MNTSQETNINTEPVQKPKGHIRRNWSFYLLLAGSLAASTYFWFSKEFTLAYQKEAFEDEQLALISTANARLKNNQENDLKLVAKSLAYAAANRIIFDDWEEIDTYFQQFVKSTNILEVFLLQDDGLVMVSTNKKLEGDYFTDTKINTMQETERTILLQDDKGRNLVVAPVVMKENRQSTLVIVYQPIDSITP